MTTTPHMPPIPEPDFIHAELRTLGSVEDDAIDLGRTGLLLAALEKPGREIRPYLRHLDKLVREVGAYAGAGTPGIDLMIEALGQVLVKRYGYNGTAEAFDDPDGANMMAVIDNRSGLPVVLGAIVIHICRALGWDMAGIRFPARFLIRLNAGRESAVLDPFDGMKRLKPRALRALHKNFAGKRAELKPRHYRETGTRDVLLRIMNNVKLRHLKGDCFAEALETAEVMLLLAPGEAALWREIGMINARLDNVAEAVAALEEYMRYEATDNNLYQTSLMLQELRRRLK